MASVKGKQHLPQRVASRRDDLEPRSKGFEPELFERSQRLACARVGHGAAFITAFATTTASSSF